MAITDYYEMMTAPANREFYENYGRTMAAWGYLERCLSEALARLAGLSPQMADAIFYSANSFSGRSAMVMACVPFARTVPVGKTFLTKAVLLANEYALTRNTLAHDHHELDWPEGGEPQWLIRSPRGGPTLSPDQIRNADHNFSLLTYIIGLSWKRGSQLLDPELSLALLRLMPRDAAAPTADHNEVNRLSDELQHLCDLDEGGLYSRPLA
ncbi:hypothetical protein [Phenylobacterium sp.]|uniref:hypothetical protein n=1 Tax=Phenylobacterium sp. TaxID=1871053 RepID=UPI002FC6D88A